MVRMMAYLHMVGGYTATGPADTVERIQQERCENLRWRWRCRRGTKEVIQKPHLMFGAALAAAGCVAEGDYHSGPDAGINDEPGSQDEAL